ncbi:MAG: YczE/YyaS/YitT family protein [Peptostreptococcaceae bacterium]
MKKILNLVARLIVGFICCAMGTVMAINSNLGLSPWDVFHQGVSNISGLTIGQVSILAGIVIVIVSCLLGFKVGFATIANMIAIGAFIDFIIYLDFIPECNNIFTGIIMILGSMFVSAIGSYLYIGCGHGCGPRDGLMVVLMQITKKPVKVIRGIIEVGALVIGWILGGFAGLGTVITAFGIGYIVQFTYKILNFNVSAIEHKNLSQGYNFFKECIFENNKKELNLE